MKRSEIWWVFGIATMLLGLVLGLSSFISKELQHFMLIMGFLATIKADVVCIEEKLK